MSVMTFRRGSIVRQKTDHVFESKCNMISMMGHHVRPYIYGIIPYTREPPEQHYYVNFAMQGMFNMDEEESSEFNDQYVYYSYLELVRDRDNKGEGDDEYIKQYFKHDGRNWTLKRLSLSCEICGASDLSGTKRCQRTRYKLQLPMKQLYFDLELRTNDHMTMAQKRHICYKFNAYVVHAVLTVGERMTICKCLDREIQMRFPKEEQNGIVGFCS